MTERPIQNNGEQNPREPSCFPVSAVVADRVSVRITVNPTDVLCVGIQSIYQEVPELEGMLLSVGERLSPHKRDPFFRGAVYTYSILAEQAAINGKKLFMSFDALDADFASIEELQRKNRLTEHLHVLKQQEEHLMRVLLEHSENTTDPDAFALGIVYSYTAFRSEEDVRKMKQAFLI